MASGVSELLVLYIRIKAINCDIQASRISDFKDVVFLTFEDSNCIKFLIWEIERWLLLAYIRDAISNYP